MPSKQTFKRLIKSALSLNLLKFHKKLNKKEILLYKYKKMRQQGRVLERVGNLNYKLIKKSYK